MAARIEYLGDVAIVIAEGMFRHGTEPAQLEAALKQVIIIEGCRKVLVDLSLAEIKSSMAIGVLASATASARNSEGHVVLCGVEPQLKRVLSIFHCFSRPLEMYDSCDDALEALQKL